MTRKLLSGVLAFAMVFGCTAPVALAEDTTVEEVEQYATYNPQFTATSYTLANKNGATATLTIAGAPAKSVSTPTISVEYLNGSTWAADTHTSATLSNDGATLTLTRNLTGPETVDLDVRVVVTYGEIDTTDTKLPATTLTITGKLTALDTYANKINDVTAVAGATTTSVKADTSKTYVFSSTKNGKAVIPVVVPKIISGSSDYVSVVEVADDDAVTYKVNFKKSNNIGSNAAGDIYNPEVAVRFTVTWADGSTANYDYYYEIEAADPTVSNLKLTAGRSTIEMNDKVELVAQAIQNDGFGDPLDYDAAELTWYVNGTKVTFNEAGDAKLKDILEDTVVTLHKRANHAITFTADKPGVFTITTSDLKNNLSASVNITVTDTLVLNDFGVGPTVSNTPAPKTVKAGSTTSVANEDYRVVLRSVSGTEVTSKIADTNVALEYELEPNMTYGGVPYGKAITEAIVKVDANGNVTVADSSNATMAALIAKHGVKDIEFTVNVYAKQGTVKKGPVTVNFTVTKPSEEATKMAIYKNGKLFAEIDDSYDSFTDPITMTTGEKVALSAVVKDNDQFTDGIDQTISWSIEKRQLDIDFANTKFATVDVNGVVTAYKASSYRVFVRVTSVANPDLDVLIPLVITGEDYEDPKPTEKPTEKPAETVTGKVVTSSSALNIRAAATTASGIVTKAAKGSVVTILGEENGFYKVQLADGKVGYASKAYIEIITADKPVVTATATTTANLRLRTSAPSGSVITTMPKGATVTVLEKGASWSKVEYNGKVGYASNSYLTFNTVG